MVFSLTARGSSKSPPCLSVVLHRSASVSAARDTTRLANKSPRVPRRKVRDKLRERGLRANFAPLITRNYLYSNISRFALLCLFTPVYPSVALCPFIWPFEDQTRIPFGCVFTEVWPSNSGPSGPHGYYIFQEELSRAGLVLWTLV